MRSPIRVILLIISMHGYLHAVSQSEVDTLISQLHSLPARDTQYVDLLNQIGNQLLKTAPLESFDFINEAMFLSDSLDYQSGQFAATIDKGSSFWVTGLYELALKYYYQAAALPTPPISTSRARLNNNIAETYKKLGNIDSALFYYRKTGSIISQITPKVYPALLYVNKADLFLDQNQIDSASKYFNEGLLYADSANHDRAKAYAMAGQSKILFIQGDIGKAFSRMHEALALMREINDQRAIIQGYQQLADLASQTGSPTISLSLLDSAQKLAQRHRAFDLLADIYHQRYMIHEAEKDFQSAIKSLNDYERLADSLKQASVTERITSIKSALESEIKNQEIALLQEQQANHKATIVRQTILFVAVLVVLIILSVFAVIYYNSLQRERKNSLRLNELNDLVNKKNAEIEQINKKLDLKLNKTTKMLVEGQQTAQLGSWEYNREEQSVDWTREAWRQLGLKEPTAKPSIDILKSRLGNRQLLVMKKAIDEVIEQRKESIIQIIVPGSNQDESRVLSLHIVPEIEDNRIVRVYGSSLDVTERVNSERQDRNIIRTLLDLSKITHLRNTNYEFFIKKLLVNAGELLQVERSSFWHYDSNQKLINCYLLYDREYHKFTTGDVLYEKDYPIYFNALYDNRAIDANDVATDPRTCEFSQNYLKNTHIVSLLDAQVQVDGKMVGVICFERRSKRSEWSLSDQRFVGSLTDIIAGAYATYQTQQLEREKVNLIRKLVKKNQNLQQFAYVISHNLRGPAAQLIGLTELYNSSGNDAMRTTIIEKIQDASKNLDEVIKDLGVLIKHQDDSYQESENELVYFQEIVELVLYELDKIVKVEQPELLFNYDPEIKLFTNRMFLAEIVQQILDNAIKFKKEGQKAKVTVSCEAKDTYLIIEIADQGLGIDMEKYGYKLFRMYQRFHLDVPGRGIGLYIAKNQLELLGGTIHIDSKPGYGTIVKLELPINTEEDTQIQLGDIAQSLK